jgi:3-hydroxymyristoyl/3-hydroxydecanoyl-(acyl carrier protein) dehydratase
MNRIIQAGVNFLIKDKIVLGKEEIELILPHRGRMLLLDKVEITKKEIIGEFLITNEVCEGHAINNKEIFRGVDYLEMTAQLLGIWLSQQLAGENKMASLRKSSFKCISFSQPGDLLKIVMPIKQDLEDKDKITPRLETLSTDRHPEKMIQQAIALDSIIFKGKDKKAEISFVELSVFNKSLAD